MLKRGLLVLGGVAVLALGAVLFSAVRAGDDADKDKKEEKKIVIFRSGGSWLGVQIADVDEDRARELGLKEAMGAEIQSVSEGSPAEEAGLKKGDVILEYQGTRIEGVAQLTRLVRETPAGRNASLRVSSGGTTRNVQVKVAAREYEHPGRMHWRHAPQAPGAPEPPLLDLDSLGDFDVPDVRVLVGPHGGPRLGAEVDTLGGQLAEYFGVKQGGGVLVRAVRKGGPGDEAGLRAGDVIIRIDNDEVEDEGDLRMAMRERRGKEFKMTVVRERREQTLTIPVPAEDRSDQGLMRRVLTPEDRDRIRKEVEEAMREAAVAREEASKAMREAAVARAEARQEIRRAYREALRHAREAGDVAAEAVEEAAAEAAEEAEEESPEEAVDDGDVEAIRDELRREQEDIRRAVEEARRVRIQMQESADQ